MYVYFPTLWFGEDKIAWATGVQWNAGDLMNCDGHDAVLLWENTTSPELIKGQITIVNSELVFPSLLSAWALEQIHNCVWERFTPYCNVLPLRLWNDLCVVMKRCLKKTYKSERRWEVSWLQTGWVDFKSYAWDRKQQLLVFPDLRTMHQQIPKRVFEQPWVSRRHAWLTHLQKATIFWWIKTGQVHTLITTPAWVFQDWLQLWDIFIIDSHKRRYKSGQDPRYRTPSVCDSIQKIYWNQLFTSWYKLAN